MSTKNEGQGMARRTFLGALVVGSAGLAWWKFGREERTEAAMAAGEGTGAAGAKTVNIVEFTDAGVRRETVNVPVIRKSEDEWKKQLSPIAFEVTRHEGTERPFTGALLNVHDKGVFRCVCCDTALFDSATKFESGTGWPSFWAPIAKENVLESADTSLGMVRTAVSCRRCDAHLGHVFPDGPKPTGLRYCMNSVSLRFAKAA